MMAGKQPETCLECDECVYICEGDYVCLKIHEIVVEEFGQPTEHWMDCQKSRNPSCSHSRGTEKVTKRVCYTPSIRGKCRKSKT